MKTIYTLCATAALTFTSCKKCYECRVMSSTTNPYGNNQSEPTVIVEKCNMTAGQIRRYVDETTTTTTTVINGKKYVTKTTVICR